MRRSHAAALSLAFLPLIPLGAACVSSSGDTADEATRVQQAQVSGPGAPTPTVTGTGTIPPPVSTARISRDHYLKDRLTALRTLHNAPAVAAALVMNGSTTAAAVSGVRKYGVAGNAQLGDAFMLKSSTKPMTGYLAARFIEFQQPIPGSLKKFSWSTTILDVFPELAATINPAYVNTTVEQLMMHTSGMPYMPLTEGADEFANITSSLVGRRYEYVKAAVIDPPQSPSPYGGGSIIVAAMLERITAVSWENLMNTWVYDDITMTNSGVGETPYPTNVNQVTSHTRNGSGTPVVWNPPPGYASEPHAPAGRNPHASILDFAKFAAANMSSAANRPGNLGDVALANALFQPPGTGHTRSGWGTGYTSWGEDPGVPLIWHNGADGKDYSLVHIMPSKNYATAVMTNVDDPGSLVGSGATHELAALWRHYATAGAYDDVINIGLGATATSTSGAGYEATKANDGSLLTRWAAPSATTTATLEVSLDGLKTISKVRVAEHYNRIQGFVIEAKMFSFYYNGFIWVQLASGTTVGSDYLASFSAIGAFAVRIRITASTGGANIAEMWAL
jgi:CubicO group peptidase (beta-lactamase class C family)